MSEKKLANHQCRDTHPNWTNDLLDLMDRAAAVQSSIGKDAGAHIEVDSAKRAAGLLAKACRESAPIVALRRDFERLTEGIDFAQPDGHTVDIRIPEEAVADQTLALFEAAIAIAASTVLTISACIHGEKQAAYPELEIFIDRYKERFKAVV